MQSVASWYLLRSFPVEASFLGAEEEQIKGQAGNMIQYTYTIYIIQLNLWVFYLWMQSIRWLWERIAQETN